MIVDLWSPVCWVIIHVHANIRLLNTKQSFSIIHNLYFTSISKSGRLKVPRKREQKWAIAGTFHHVRISSMVTSAIFTSLALPIVAISEGIASNLRPGDYLEQFNCAKTWARGKYISKRDEFGSFPCASFSELYKGHSLIDRKIWWITTVILEEKRLNGFLTRFLKLNWE